MDQSIERWLPVPEWEGYYEVSSHGRLKSLHRGRERIMRPVKIKNGYMTIMLQARSEERKQLCYVHRLVLSTFVGPCPRGMEAAHEDGDRANNRLSNLRWDTRLANHADKNKHGTMPRGELAPWSRLTEQQVRAIRDSAETQQSLARRHGVSQTMISLIKRGRRWSHALP